MFHWNNCVSGSKRVFSKPSSSKKASAKGKDDFKKWYGKACHGNKTKLKIPREKCNHLIFYEAVILQDLWKKINEY